MSRVSGLILVVKAPHEPITYNKAALPPTQAKLSSVSREEIQKMPGCVCEPLAPRREEVEDKGEYFQLAGEGKEKTQNFAS